MIRNGSLYVLATSSGGRGGANGQQLTANRLTRQNGGDCSIQTTFLICTGRRLTEDRANVGDGDAGRATSCGGRHIVSCERSERSVSSACSGPTRNVRFHLYQ